MKIIVKCIGIIFLSLMAILVLFAGKSLVFSRSYSNVVCGGEEIKNDDRLLLKTNFNIPDTETLILIYAKGNSMKEGGIVLTNQRILSFLKGQTIKTCDYAMLSEVKLILFDSTKNINGAVIKIEKKDSTAFAFALSQYQHNDVLFIEKLRAETRKRQKGQ